MGRNVVDRIRRVDESHYVLADLPNAYVTYEGRTDTFDAPTSSAVWQIKRIVKLSTSEEVLYANDGKYNCVWDDRATLFPALPPLPPGPPSPSTGLSRAGRITIVPIDNTSWTPLPATPLDERNALAIQNTSDQEIKIQYDNTVAGYEGVIIGTFSERQYDITDSIVIYAKSKTSAVDITVEELS